MAVYPSGYNCKWPSGTRGSPFAQIKMCKKYRVTNTLLCLSNHTHPPSIIKDLEPALYRKEIYARPGSEVSI